MDNSTHHSIEQGEKTGFWTAIKDGYEALVMTVIRPPRAMYSEKDLGPSLCTIGAEQFRRVDIKLQNKQGLAIQCSWWKPRRIDQNPGEKLPCIISLHGNSSCRLGCLELAYYALASGFTIFALDFSGSGMSEGEYVSLGFHESEDISIVTSYLRSTNEVTSIVLWGRSMGSVAAMMYAEKDPSISSMVLDSPFASLPQLAHELVDNGQLNVPKFAVSIVMRLVRGSIKKRAKFDMFKLKPISSINKCSIPCFFGIAKEDELIPNHHGIELHKQHPGPKHFFSFDGGHNTPRPPEFFTSAIQFIRTMIGLPPLHQLQPPGHSIPPNTYIEIKDPLEPGMVIEDVYIMKIKDLKAAIVRTGFSYECCLEKKDLVELVIQLHNRYINMIAKESDSETQRKNSKCPERVPEQASRDLDFGSISMKINENSN